MPGERFTPPGITSAELPASLNPAPVIDGGFLDGATDPALIESEMVAPEGASEEVENAYWLGLPAREFWKVEHPSDCRIETPRNEYGLVDERKLFAAVRPTISKDYPWPGRTDRHHKYWTAATFIGHQEMTGERSAAFREMPFNIVRIPRVFHNWIHAVTVPPPIPDPEVMDLMLEAWTIVAGFYKSVQSTVEKNRLFEREERRRGGYTDDQAEMIREILMRELAGVVMHLDELQSIPQELWPFSPNVRSQVAAGKVGHVLTKGCLHRTKQVRYAQAA